MVFVSVNPATGLTNKTFSLFAAHEINTILDSSYDAFIDWRTTNFENRAVLMRNLAQIMRKRKSEFANLITEEMGKLLKEAEAEIEKCALGCEYYADNAAGFLADEIVGSDASKSYITYAPLGVILAIMPWNFPFWQLIRAAAPALMAGNGMVLKHASNVPRCAIALDDAFKDAGFPEGLFRSLLISSQQTEAVIADKRVAAITLTGSCAAGQKVASTAARHYKKCVLELGGSDPFIVLDDADLDFAARNAVIGRFQNAGQSCIAAKRFIVIDSVADQFVERFTHYVAQLKPGNPAEPATTLAPMARADLREELHAQVLRSIELGAKAVIGCKPHDGSGAYYAASILDHVKPGMPAFDEELFGPVAAIVRVSDEKSAIKLANQTEFGLGGSVWSTNNARAENIARQLQCGCAFVNGIVKSDPRLPFGGIKSSGYGRELSYVGIREFVNIKTVWIK